MGESEVEAAAATDVHFTGDGVVDGGGMFAGANTACVAVRIAGGKFGGGGWCCYLCRRIWNLKSNIVSSLCYSKSNSISDAHQPSMWTPTALTV